VTFENTRDEALKKVRLNPPKDASAARFGGLPQGVELEVLGPKQAVTVSLSLDLGGGGASQRDIKVDVRTSAGLYPATLVVPAAELLRPLLLTSADFTAAQKALSGFNESTSKAVSLGPAEGLHAKLLAAANLTLVADPVSAAGGIGQWAGAILGGGARVLVTVKGAVAGSGATGSVTVNCDDAMLAATLLDVVKKSVA
jgi:hypothetical protein